MRATKKFFTDCFLAGKKYYDTDEVFDKLRIGTKLMLIAEPDNRYDENAVAVAYKDESDTVSKDNVYQLGYIPRSENYAIAQLLNAGWKDIFECKITALRPEKYPNEQIHLTIRINNNKKAIQKV